MLKALAPFLFFFFEHLWFYSAGTAWVDCSWFCHISSLASFATQIRFPVSFPPSPASMSHSPNNDIFHFDDWDSTFATLSTLQVARTSPFSSSATATPASDVTSRTSSGEFNAFTVVGKKLIGGVTGGGGRRMLFHVPSVGQDVCLGCISTSKFCIKPCANGSATCGAQAHLNKKFSPSHSCGYF